MRLSHAIETALREWGLWLPRNPVKMVRRPTVPQGRKRGLEDGEEERLLAACDRGRTPLLKQLVILAIETGMRRGEMLGLRWEHDRQTAWMASTCEDNAIGESKVRPMCESDVHIKADVRYAPNSDQILQRSEMTLCAISGHQRARMECPLRTFS